MNTVHGPGTAFLQNKAVGWPATERALLVLLLGLLIYAHRHGLAGMVALWDVSPMYSYGYTVPFISAYLLWTKRSALRALTPAPARLLGALVLALGIAMLISARAGGIQLLEQLAFIVSLVAAILLLFGTGYLRVAWAAVVYLLLMIPLWDAFTEPLHAPFQYRSAAIGVWLLQNMGIPAHGEGTMISLPGITLEVARACSGVNYLVAVVALGLPLAYLYLDGIWRRLLLIVSAVFVAALSNGLRVALIGVLAHYQIGSPLHGPLHVLHGLFVAGIGYVVLFGGLRLLGRSRRKSDLSDHDAQDVTRTPHRVPRWAAASVAVIAVIAGTGVGARGVNPVELAIPLDQLPTQLGPWTSTVGLAAVIPDIWSDADAEIRKRFTAEGREPMDVYIAYFRKQEQRRSVANHRTADLHRRASRIAVRAPDTEFEANLVSEGDGSPRMLFWYDVGSTVRLTPHSAKLQTLWNAVTVRQSEGAVIVIAATSAAAADPAARRAAMVDLGSRVHRAIAPHLGDTPTYHRSGVGK